jgi:uncharacterized caspase-like protein
MTDGQSWLSLWRFQRFGALAAVWLCLLVVPTHAQDELQGVALVIGQSKYEHIAALPNPAQDAREIAKLLTDLGFDARSVSDRDSSKLARDLERFVEDAEGADVAFLYYAGHGIEAGGENWLVPVDADTSSLSNAREALVPMAKLVEELQKTVPITVVLLDACRTNPFPAGSLLKQTPTGSGEPVGEGGLTVVRGAKALADTGKPDVENLGTVIGFAAEPGRPALDGDPGSNSPYAAALLRHLVAMKGAEFGSVMRMVTEEVYLDTKTQQRPWTNESLRRLLYFGIAPEEPTGDDALITGERRQLLLTIAELPDLQRAQVEMVASKDGVPLDALYGVLRALGADKMPEKPDEMSKVLEEQAERLKKMMAEREALRSDDPEMKRLMATADRAIDEGAIETARSFLDKAVARVEATRSAVDDAEETVKRKRIADATVYARRAEASSLIFDFAGAASDYGKAFDLIEKWDERLRWNYKNLQAESLSALGGAKGDTKALQGALSAYEEVLDFIPRNDRGRDWAVTRNNMATVYQAIGQRELDTGNMEKAADILRDSLVIFERTKDLENASNARHNLGNVLLTLGERKSSISLLEQAAAEMRKALAMRDRKKFPMDWASTQNNLGLALNLIAERKGGGKFYDEAEAAYRAALEVYTQGRTPAEWAMVLNNLGNTLSAQGNERADLKKLDEAAQAFRDALTVRTKETFPLAWAGTRLNLGSTLYYATRFDAGSSHLDEAAQAYEDALAVYPRDVVPLDWASAKNNYGSVLQMRGQRAFNAEDIEKGIAEFTDAREVFTRESLPLDWAMTHLNAGNSYMLLAALRGNAEHYRDAADEYRSALEVYTRDDVPEQWAMAMSSLGSALHWLSNSDPDLKTLRQAIEARRAALEVLTPETAAIDWANTQSDLGMSLNNLGIREQTSKYADEAEQAFVAATQVYTRDAQPLQWAMQQNNLGDVYWNKGTLGKQPKALEEALRYFAAARKEMAKEPVGMSMIPLLDQKVELINQVLGRK